MKVEIKALKSSEEYLKNQVEYLKDEVDDLKNLNQNVLLNNEHLVDRVEKAETENARLSKTLREIEVSGLLQQLTTVMLLSVI